MDGRMQRELKLAKRIVMVAIGGLLAVPWLGCDSKKDVPPPVDAPTTAPAPTITTQPAAGTTRPTKEDLLTGPRQSLRLGGFPLRLDVPKGWKLNSTTTTTFLEGDAPHGEVRINLVPTGQFLKAGTIDAMEKKAIAQAAASPNTIQIIPMRSIGGSAKAMERREIQERTVEWTVRVFVPQEPDYVLDMIDFMGLTVEQYKDDKDFLEGILRTLRYDSAGGLLD